MRELTAKQLFIYLQDYDPNLRMEGDADIKISGIASVFHYRQECLTWVKGQDKADMVKELLTAVVCRPETVIRARVKFLTKNPKDLFFLAADYLSGAEQVPGISETAVLGSSVVLGENVSIGNGTCVGEDVTIGSGTVIEANVTICDHVAIGECCLIKAGAVIGGKGFGYSKNDGQYRTIRHYGSVIIGNHVDIGSNTCIDRGTMDDTVIADGVKIDNLCHIAHNVRIGKNTIVIANSTICGSVQIGENVYIAPHSVIMNQLKIDDGAMIGMAAAVTKDVQAGTVNIGCPAKAVRIRRDDEWMKY